MVQTINLGNMWDKIFSEITIKETLRYWVYENKRVIKEGIVEGNTWTSTGKTQLAVNFRQSTNSPINTFYYTVSTINYSESKTPVDVATYMTLTSSELTTTGTYTSVGGGNSVVGHYNDITVNLTLTSGQSVIFQITYTFSPAGTITTSCIDRLCNAGLSNDYIRSISVSDAGGIIDRKDSTNGNVLNVLTCDNATNFTFGAGYTIIYINFMHAGGVFFYQQSVSIPVLSGEEMDIQGVFTFG